MEKTNSDTELESRSKRYTDKHQSEKIKANELMRIIFAVVIIEKRKESRQKRILPPSNSYIGRRLSIPKKSDELTNKFKNSELSLQRGSATNAKIRFTKGPAIQSAISFL